MFEELNIVRLKAVARNSYLEFYSIMDEYDCGAELLKTMSADASTAAAKFNDAMAKLETLDPTCPKGKRL